MYCPRCGVAQPSIDQRYCTSCGTALPPPQLTSMTPPLRPGVVTALAVLHFIFGAIDVLVAAALVAGSTFADDTGVRAALTIAGICVAVVAALQIVCGVGLATLRPYGRILQMIFASVGLISFPFGTLIGILILVYLTKPGVKLLFSGRPATGFTAEEQQQIAAARGSSTAVIAIVAVAGVFLLMMAIAILAAIAIPGLLRARIVANEAAAMSTIRDVQNAEITYAAQNGQLYDLPACLVTPFDCLPGFVGSGLLDASVFEDGPRSGYVFRFEPGQPAGPVEAGSRTNVSRTSITTFAVVAEPLSFNTSGARSFCGDSTGVLCTVPGARLDASGGRCPVGCESIR